MPAARVGDPIAHSNAGLGMALGILAGVAAGAVLVGATIATGGAALAVVAAVGGAAALTSFGGLKGMAIGGASMGPPTGALAIGSVNVLINTRPATMTAMASAICAKDPGPIPLATGSSTVRINACMAGREGETMACSAKVVAACSPNVIIGGASAQDPRVTITPEIPPWAVTSLQVLGVVGAVMALPFSVAALGVGGTIAVGVLSAGGSYIGGKAMRALAESMGMSEAGVLTMEAFGELGGGMLGGATGARRFGTAPKPPPPWKGPTDYSKIANPKNVGASTKPTPRQRQEMIKANKEQNGGILRDDKTGELMVESKKSVKGVTPPQNEAQIDHKISVDKGGTRDIKNLELRTRKNNRDKSNK